MLIICSCGFVVGLNSPVAGRRVITFRALQRKGVWNPPVSLISD